MMMAKPAPEEEEETAPPSFATPAVQTPGTVEDLERRLQMLGGTTAPDPVAVKEDSKPMAVPTPAAAPAAIKGGKNALLARIMAAKEKSQAAQQKQAPPAEPVDLLSDNFDAPAKTNDPPPSYDTNFLQPPPATTMAADAPPMFTDSLLSPPSADMAFPPPPPIEAVAPPPAMMSFAPPAASAPAFEDLLDPSSSSQPLPDAVPPPVEDDFLAALDPAEREALLEEQRKIMEQIEESKSNNEASSAAARAMAFDQRSAAAVAKVAGSSDRNSSRPAAAARRPETHAQVPLRTSQDGSRTVDLGGGEQVELHGAESTTQAIKDGTAVVVQCVSCQGWMQVTESATLMFCPTCQVVSPVNKEGAATGADMEQAAQMASDAELAEKLQQEEYSKAGGGTRRKKAAPKPQRVEEGQSWYDWLTGAPTKPNVPSQGSAEIRRSPAVASGSSRGPTFVPATTGAESHMASRNYGESQSLMD